jgi:hypothetical protein
LTVAKDWQEAMSKVTERVLVELRAEKSDIIFPRLGFKDEVGNEFLPSKHIITSCYPDVAIWQGAAGLAIGFLVPKLEEV